MWRAKHFQSQLTWNNSNLTIYYQHDVHRFISPLLQFAIVFVFSFSSFSAIFGYSATIEPCLKDFYVVIHSKVNHCDAIERHSKKRLDVIKFHGLLIERQHRNNKISNIKTLFMDASNNQTKIVEWQSCQLL